MSYIDALKINDTIHIVERAPNGKRFFQKIPAKYVFYVKDHKGTYTSIYGDPLVKVETNNYKKFQKELNHVNQNNLFEHDINPVFRYLEENYKGSIAPNLHIAFFDIEVDFDPKRGFSSPNDPYCAVNAVSVHQSWTGKLISLVLKPDTLTWDEASAICDKFENTTLCRDEAEFYEKFFEAIEDADVLSGWNSTTFDIPYMVRRLEKIKSRDETKKFCLWNQHPTKRTFEKFGKEHIAYDLHGRIHLDYLDLYQKHTYHEMHSYRLDFVAEYEISEGKIAYEGSLDKLYNDDFEKFIDYNRQDTILLVKIDNGKNGRLIELSNQLAHDNCVLLPTTLGSVAMIEQAIVNEIHNKNLIAPSKKHGSSKSTSVAGAYVASPNKGIHNWIGSVDINSLYPSVIRSLNISPETLVGQIRPEKTLQTLEEKIKQKSSNIWGDLFAIEEFDDILEKSDTILTADLEDGSIKTQTASDWYNLIFQKDSNLCITANGTIFRTNTKGIIPGLLERWYSERVEIRKQSSELFDQSEKITDPDEKKKMLKEVGFLDKRQLIKKILLNSLYGALLNPYMRFFDQRMGQSVTLTGRCITRHMSSKINDIFTGKYDHNGVAIKYGDTDSAYFSAYDIFKETEFDWTKENVMELYDSASEEMNKSFPSYMMTTFNVSQENGEIIQAGREVLATKGLFIKKKRYALLCYDVEGRRKDVNGKPGAIKAMGVDLKRADTPQAIQVFLESVLIKILTDSSENEILAYVKEFRKKFRKWPGWEKGTPKRVNGLTQKVELEKKFGKISMAGHQRASKNWNELRQMYHDYHSMEIQDGFKVVVCKLLPNPLNLVSVAYPIDEQNLPDWFKELPFDHDGMEDSLIDKKLDNLVGVLKWRLKIPEDDTTFSSLFSS